jgi:hypothetical protein
MGNQNDPMRTHRKTYIFQGETQMTPAQSAGFIIGKKYEVIGGYDEEHSTKVGTIVMFVKDDQSIQPKFEAEGGRADYIYLTNLKELEKSNVNYNVSIVDNNTTIVLQKRLSVEEVHAFLKAVGV